MKILIADDELSLVNFLYRRLTAVLDRTGAHACDFSSTTKSSDR